MVDDLTGWLSDHGFKAEGLHGDMKQSQRTVVMDAFKAGRTSILVATDVAARGIDVDDINCVFNYDIPQNAEYYVHRIGRTGRAGKSGSAYTPSAADEISSARWNRFFALQKPRQHLHRFQCQTKFYRSAVRKARRNLNLPDRKKLTSLSRYGAVADAYRRRKRCSTFSAEQIAAAALELYGAQQSDLPDATGLNREKKRRSPKDYVKFIIDAGYNARMVPNFIVGAIAERTGLSGRDIGKIEIFEDNTTVEIPQEQAEEVLSSMQDCRINGKKGSNLGSPD